MTKPIDHEAAQAADSIALAEELSLKSKTEDELLNVLIESGNETWTGVEHDNVEAAYHLARIVHQKDVYKAQPYIYHLLRVATRITGYLHINDSEVVMAALLHDSVEDRAKELIRLGDSNVVVSKEPQERQRLAFEKLAILFSPRVARLVACVTNAPNSPHRVETYDEWLERYARKVEAAVQTPEGCLIKFADWCDNGLGVIHSEEPADSPKLLHFKRKYALALPIFERKFQAGDVLQLLDPSARAYVSSQLALGHERLAS